MSFVCLGKRNYDFLHPWNISPRFPGLVVSTSYRLCLLCKLSSAQLVDLIIIIIKSSNKQINDKGSGQHVSSIMMVIICVANILYTCTAA